MSQFLQNFINSLTITVAIIALFFWIVVLMSLYLLFRQVMVSEMERVSTKDPTMTHWPIFRILIWKFKKWGCVFLINRGVLWRVSVNLCLSSTRVTPYEGCQKCQNSNKTKCYIWYPICIIENLCHLSDRGNSRDKKRARLTPNCWQITRQLLALNGFSLGF